MVTEHLRTSEQRAQARTDAHIRTLKREIDRMHEEDIDVFLSDLRRYPACEPEDSELRFYCQQRLQTLAREALGERN